MSRYSDLILNTSGLAGYWRMNDAATPFTDLVAARNGAVTGDALYSQAALIVDSTAKSYGPNAGTTVVVVPTNAALHPGDTFTFECWVKLSGVGAVFNMIALGTGDFEVNISTTGVIRLVKQGTGNSCITNNAYTDTASPHHIVVTKSGATNVIYRDNVAVPVTVTNQTIVAASSDVYLASKVGVQQPWNGLIGEIALYNAALSADQVTQHYTIGKALWPKRSLLGVGA